MSTFPCPFYRSQVTDKHDFAPPGREPPRGLSSRQHLLILSGDNYSGTGGYRHRPSVGTALKTRQKTASAEVKEISWKAQNRLHRRYVRLMAKGKTKQKVVTAVARELLGFIWAIGISVEKGYDSTANKRAA